MTVVLTGEAPAVKDFDGIVMQSLEQLSVEALPTEIPPHIEVDISGLTQIDDAIHVRDLIIPGDVTVHAEPDTLVVKIEAPRLAVEEEEAAEEAEEAAAATEGAAEGEAAEEEEA